MEIVISSAGIVSAIGCTLREFRENLFRGKSGLSNIRGRWVPSDFPVPFGGVVESIPSSSFLSRAVENPSEMEAAVCALLEQLQAQLTRIGKIDAILLGARGAPYLNLAVDVIKDRTQIPRAMRLAGAPLLDLAARFLETSTGTSPPPERRYWLSNACASGNELFGFALKMMRASRWQNALLLNLDLEFDAPGLHSLNSLGAVSCLGNDASAAARPLARDRCGFVKTNAGSAFLLEARRHTEEPGPGLGLLAGFGNSSDAYRPTLGREDSQGVIYCMRLALRDAGLTPRDIDYISAHATGTPQGDVLEAAALSEVFGDEMKRIFVGALKAQVGHAMQASGGIEALATLLMLEEQRIAPILNLTEENLAFPLRVVTHEARNAKLAIAMNNNVGFGGQNTSVIFRRIPSGA